MGIIQKPLCLKHHNPLKKDQQLFTPEEYLTITEVAARLKLKPKSIKNKMAAGILKKGVHYFRPQGLGPRFKWSSVVVWLEQSPDGIPTIDDEKIPMANGYNLGQPSLKP